VVSNVRLHRADGEPAGDVDVMRNKRVTSCGHETTSTWPTVSRLWTDELEMSHDEMKIETKIQCSIDQQSIDQSGAFQSKFNTVTNRRQCGQLTEFKALNLSIWPI